MDINLAGELDGIETATKLNEIYQVPLVFLSALSDEVTLQRAKLTKPFGYLFKPYDPLELKTVVELTLARSSLGREEPSELHLEATTTIDSNDIINILERISIFASLSRSEREFISQKFRLKEHSAGEVLISEGDKVSSLFIPLSGRVNLLSTSISGKELILAIVGPHDPVGLFYFHPILSGSVSIKTHQDMKALWIRVPEWKEVLDRHPQLYPELLKSMALHLANRERLASSLAYAPVEERIITTLLDLQDRFGKSIPNMKGSRVFITRKELAECTGTTPETAIRITKNLERDNLIDLTRPGIIKILESEKLLELIS
jgi:CRP-like cAMP-binding protein